MTPKIIARDYDPSFRPWWEKSAITLGMGMTEKQGGTDVRTNITSAVPAGEGYAITGQKWFMSAPMCDAFLVLAQAPGGLTCFLMPRFRPDGSVNALHIQRLKDKLGNRSNASSEVEFAGRLRDGGWARRASGIRTILQMVQLTRLDCAIASAGLMRMALAQALHHARHRIVFQKHLVDQPMMRSRAGRHGARGGGGGGLGHAACAARSISPPAIRSEAARARMLTPAVKYLGVQDARPSFVYEAMECLGGNGYVEDSLLPRLYREAPVNAIWEGSGNVMCLDVMRAMSCEGDSILSALANEADGADEVGEMVTALRAALRAPDAAANARLAVEHLAILAATAAMQSAGCDGAEAFARTRLGGRARMFGAGRLPPDEADRVLQRALPA